MANGSVPQRERAKRARTGAPTTGGDVAATSAPTRPTLAAEPPKRRRDPLLSAICHDLRAPLAAVTMGAHFVLQKAQRDEGHARSVKILEAMLRSCTQMERLIRNLADLSEIEANEMTLRLNSHDSREMLELTAQAWRETATARSVTIEVLEPERPITIRCDRERLLRAIGHVVENAVAQAPEGSLVSLSVALREGVVSFAVVDRGPGLTAEVVENLCDREWHAQRANRAGAGFGLAIARGYLAAHDGKLEVDSRTGDRTTFTLSAPKDGPTNGPTTPSR